MVHLGVSGAYSMMNTQLAPNAISQHGQVGKVDVSAYDALPVAVALRKGQIALLQIKNDKWVLQMCCATRYLRISTQV